MLFANLDVVGSVSAWCIAHIGSDQRVQEKLRDELLKSDTVESSIYLDSVLKESARLQPILAISFPERTVQDITYGPLVIPAGVWFLDNCTYESID
jgi:cytochrome P450